MASFDRVYELTAILQSSRYAVSAQELAARLECSLPTVKRYLAKLRNEYNLPVTYSQKYQGYILDKKNDDQVEFPGLWFNVSELHALLAIHELIGGLDPGLLRAELQPLRERIEKLLAGRGVSTGELVKRIQFVGAGIRLCCPLAFRAAATALIERTRLKLNYHSRGENSISTRTISPQRLLYYRGNWYLAAYCHTRGGLRVMALERMSDIVTQNHPATEVDDQTMAAELTSSFGIFTGPPNHQAVLLFTSHSARWVAEEQWHPAQEGRWLSDGRYELRVPYSDQRELVYYHGNLLRHLAAYCHTPGHGAAVIDHGRRSWPAPPTTRRCCHQPHGARRC
jgi:proteasome accessory factor C